MAGALVKPNMRNLVYNSAKKDIGISLIVGTVFALLYKFGHTEPLRRKYENFYKNYDVDKVVDDMIKAGVFDSVKN